MIFLFDGVIQFCVTVKTSGSQSWGVFSAHFSVHVSERGSDGQSLQFGGLHTQRSPQLAQTGNLVSQRKLRDQKVNTDLVDTNLEMGILKINHTM